MTTDDIPAGARVRKGQWLLSRGEYEEAVAEFEAAGKPMTGEQRKAYAMMCVRRGWARVACQVLLHVLDQPSAEEWLECGRLCLERGWLDDASYAYGCIDRAVSRKDVIACGYKFLKAGDFEEALGAFKEAGYAKGYVACGKAYLEYGLYRPGVECYALAKKPAPVKLLLDCGRDLLLSGALELAVEAYDAAGQPVTREMWIEAGDRLMYKAWYSDAERIHRG